MNVAMPGMFDKADATLAKQKAEEIEKLKQEKYLERLAKKEAKVKHQRQQILAKLVAPTLLLISVLVSLMLWWH